MAAMPSGSGFRLFRDGVTGLSHLKAQDYRHMMVQLMFAVHGLFDHLDIGDDVVTAIVAHANWYQLARQSALDQEEILEMQVRYFYLIECLQIFKEQSPSVRHHFCAKSIAQIQLKSIFFYRDYISLRSTKGSTSVSMFSSVGHHWAMMQTKASLPISKIVLNHGHGRASAKTLHSQK
jgi:hypothetical protein